jgi:hypothetical protein
MGAFFEIRESELKHVSLDVPPFTFDQPIYRPSRKTLESAHTKSEDG